MPRKKTTNYAELSAGVRLSTHEKICAERWKTIQEAIKDLNKEVKSLRQEVSKGKGAISVLVFLGTIIAGIVGFLKWDG
jgi:flagellar biosynthesis chaperone FliJ